MCSIQNDVVLLCIQNVKLFSSMKQTNTSIILSIDLFCTGYLLLHPNVYVCMYVCIFSAVAYRLVCLCIFRVGTKASKEPFTTDI